MKMYIAGKITNEPNYAIKFLTAEVDMSKQGHAVMNPTVLPEEGFEFDDYMKICLAMIDVCEGVYMLNNWETSKGANIERAYAMALNKQIFYQSKEEIA